jgi:hypothetical protein
MEIGGRSRGACVCSRLHGFRCAHQTRSTNPSETSTRHHFFTTSLHLLSDLLHHLPFSLSVRRCISTSINNADITLRSWIPTPEPPSRYEWIDLPHVSEPFIGLHLPGAALALRNHSSVPEDRDRDALSQLPSTRKVRSSAHSAILAENDASSTSYPRTCAVYSTRLLASL